MLKSIHWLRDTLTMIIRSYREKKLLARVSQIQKDTALNKVVFFKLKMKRNSRQRGSQIAVLWLFQIKEHLHYHILKVHYLVGWSRNTQTVILPRNFQNKRKYHRRPQNSTYLSKRSSILQIIPT